MRELSKTINEYQREAILSINGPVLVLAGAGSGKTLVITEKIAHLIINENVAPENIMAITFTNKAAAEMRSRVLAIMPNIKPYRLSIRTFHSTCLRILKDNYFYIGYKKDFVVIDDADKIAIIKKIIKEKKYPVDALKAKGVAKYISYIKNSTDGQIDTAF